MNIQIINDDNMPTNLTGGEYAICEVPIYVDPKLPLRTKQDLIIHSIIENYCRQWEHSKVEELTEYISEGLDLLESG